MPGRRCRREGCGRPPRNGYEYCTQTCARLDAEFYDLQRRTARSTPAGTAAWVALVEVADKWTEYQRLRGRLFSKRKRSPTVSTTGA